MTVALLMLGAIAVITIILILMIIAIGAAPTALIIALISLVISILAYHRTGGTADLLKKFQTGTSSEDLKKQMERLTATTDSLREKTADALDRLEKFLRKTGKEE